MNPCHFERSLPIGSIQGADYNPRRISPESFVNLKKSMAELGTIKPILVNRLTNIIIAGHQRTKALRANGATHVPAMMLDKVTLPQEMRFNQLHNAADENFHDVRIQVVNFKLEVGYQWVPFENLSLGKHRPGNVSGANARNSIIQMMQSFGNWGSSVADLQGNVLISKQYALCTHILRMPLLVYAMPDEKVEPLLHYFKLDYGEYCYDGLNTKTYNQSFCQFKRLSTKSLASKKTSPLYEGHILPYVKRGMRILDFGAGMKEYATRLQEMGHDVTAIEFFEKTDGRYSLNIKQLYKDIAKLGRRIASGKLFDVCIADVVLSSCNSPDAENDVLHCLNFFCKMGGMIFISGRPLELVTQRSRTTKVAHTKGQARRYVEFLDKDNISAIHRQGKWTFQKFHDKEQLRAIARRYMSTRQSDVKFTKYASGWQIAGRKRLQVSMEETKERVRREFNLPLPSGNSVNKHDFMIDSINTYAANFPHT